MLSGQQTRKNGMNRGSASAGGAAVASAIYAPAVVSTNVPLPMAEIGDNLHQVIEGILKEKHEGKCISEGYVKPDSVKLLSISCGLVERGDIVVYKTAFECMTCFPVEGTVLHCLVKDITKAGIRAESAQESPSPMVIFVAKDHHFNASHFSQVNVGDIISVRVIGQRFELNDKFVSVIAELLREPKSGNLSGNQTHKRPRIQIGEAV